MGFIVLEAVHDFLRHCLTDLGVGPLALGDAAHRNIAVGDHADEAVAIGYRQHAAIALLHHLSGMAQRIVRAGQLGIAGHHVADLHVVPPR